MKLINRILGLLLLISACWYIIFLINTPSLNINYQTLTSPDALPALLFISAGIIPQLILFILSLKFPEKMWLLIISILVLIGSVYWYSKATYFAKLGQVMGDDQFKLIDDSGLVR
jgi:hypothetical protein